MPGIDIRRGPAYQVTLGRGSAAPAAGCRWEKGGARRDARLGPRGRRQRAARERARRLGRTAGKSG